MSGIRRDFGDESRSARVDTLARGAGEDYALVIGVNDYPQLRPLRGAVADARAFIAWLLDSAGGALRTENVQAILSTQDPLGPVGHEINDALETIFQRASQSGGRRFYFYFSGHGCVGDRANDLALCLANWSPLRRRAALSSEAWLDVIVRSGVFDEVAFFLDCCRVWATRAVGLPPHVDFAKPIARPRGTRVFTAYATEFQRAAVEVDGPDSRESRGIFTQVLIDGLRGMARASDDSINAAALKRYIEKATEQRAREFGFFQRAEVVNGWEDSAGFGTSQPSWLMPRRTPSPSRPPDSSRGSSVDLAAEDVSSVGWIASYLRYQASGQFDLRRPVNEDPQATSRLVILVLPNSRRRQAKMATPAEPWSIMRGDQACLSIDLGRKSNEREGMVVFSAKLTAGTYQLHTRGRMPRTASLCMFPGWTTMIAFDDAFDPRFEHVRVFLVQGVASELPHVAKLEHMVAHRLMLMNSGAPSSREPTSDAQPPSSRDNPLQWLVEAHRLARQPRPDVTRIEALAHQIEAMVGPCADIDALRLRAALLQGRALPPVHATQPPMLRESLVAFTEASHERPDLIPAGSLLEYACVERYVDSPLSTWPAAAHSSSDSDWLTTLITDEVTRCRGDTATLDARTIARELGVPTHAVITRINATRDHTTRESAEFDTEITTRESAEFDTGATTELDETKRREDPMLDVRSLRIAGYSLERVIGKGGMGRVYLAKQNDSGLPVAIKVMLPQSSIPKEARQRFLREIHHMAALQHQRMIALLDQGEAQRSFYFVMPYYERGNLAQWVEHRARPKVEEVIQVMLDVLEGLAHAHQQGYVHRDIKPQNILLDQAGRAVVADFGLAKCFEEAHLWDITKSGATMGTFAFMPREQIVNFKRVRPATDVWAAAAVLYWLVAGVPPRQITGRKQSFLAVLHCNTPIVSLRERAPFVPRAFSDLMDAALSDDPARRPENAGAFRASLLDALGTRWATAG